MKLITSRLNRYYRTMQRKYSEILWYGDETRREIALTFDDGPHPRDTPQVLEMLAKHNARATFFLIGRAVEQHPDLVRRIHQSGHQTAIHCYRHTPFPLENPERLRKQLDQTAQSIAQVCSILPETVKKVRPPYGAFNHRTLAQLIQWGYQPVLWSSIPAHWMQPFNWSIRQIMEEVFPGAIIVLHDGHGHGSKVAKIVDSVVPKLKDQGYLFVKIEDMKRSRNEIS